MLQTMTVALLLVIALELGVIVFFNMTEPEYSDDSDDSSGGPSDKSP